MSGRDQRIGDLEARMQELEDRVRDLERAECSEPECDPRLDHLDAELRDARADLQLADEGGDLEAMLLAAGRVLAIQIQRIGGLSLLAAEPDLFAWAQACERVRSTVRSTPLRSRLLRILQLPETAYPRAADETLLAAVEEAHESLRRTVDDQALELAALHRRLSGAAQ